jgi:hypothetical protein
MVACDGEADGLEGKGDGGTMAGFGDGEAVGLGF